MVGVFFLPVLDLLRLFVSLGMGFMVFMMWFRDWNVSVLGVHKTIDHLSGLYVIDHLSGFFVSHFTSKMILICLSGLFVGVLFLSRPFFFMKNHLNAFLCLNMNFLVLGCLLSDLFMNFYP
jgi:hypothetical protein